MAKKRVREYVTLKNVVITPTMISITDENDKVYQLVVDQIPESLRSRITRSLNIKDGKVKIRKDIFEEIKSLLIKELIATAGFEVKNETVYLDGKVVPKSLAFYIRDKLIQSFKENGTVESSKYLTSLRNFIKKLEKNPVGYIIDQIAAFLVNGKLPITLEGDIVAYKKVNPDYTSIWDNKTLNRPGDTVELPLEECDTNPDEACSSGLHVCSYEYLPMFGAHKPEHFKVVVCKISPEDVVAVPNKEIYKMRCRKYTVIADVTKDVVEKGDVLSEFGIYLSEGEQ